MLILVYIRPLPDVTYKVINTKWRSSGRIGINISRWMIRIESFTAFIDFSYLAFIPLVTPRISSVFDTTLSNILPLPFMWKTMNNF
jgi:hypothetical protein